MLEKIKNLLLGYNSKSYARLLAKHSDCVEWVNSQTAHIPTRNFNERLYILLVQEPVKKPCGQYPGFSSFDKGYRDFCGPRSKCKCSAANQSSKLQSFHKTRTPEQKQQTVAKTERTTRQRYGVANVAQVPEVQQKTRHTNLERYGANTPFESEEIQAKIKHTNLERYGVEFPFQSSEIRSKSHAALCDRYGNDYMFIARKKFLDQNANKNPFVVYQEKIQASLLKNYQVLYPMQNTNIALRAKNTLVKNHGVKNPAQLHIDPAVYEILEDSAKFKELCETYSFKELCEVLGVSESIVWARHDRYDLGCYTKSVRSQYEEEITDWLVNLGVEFRRNVKVVDKTVDFLITDTIAIEFNGLYTHSENSHYGKLLKIDRNYHYNKFKNCEQQGIQLFTVFEDEWNTRKNIIKNRIKVAINQGSRGAPARKLTVAEISSNVASEFLDLYHLQGAVNSSVHLGAYDDNNLVSVMSFIQRSQGNWELNRFSSDYSMHNGLFSKMLKYFERKFAPTKVYSFSDNRWSTGNVYNKNGFELEKQLRPDYTVTNYQTREHKFKWRKSRIAARFGIDTSNKTEVVLIRELKWDRIWDCGKRRWAKVY